MFVTRRTIAGNTSTLGEDGMEDGLVAGREEGTEADHQSGGGRRKEVVGDTDEAGRYPLSTTCKRQRSSAQHHFTTHTSTEIILAL